MHQVPIFLFDKPITIGKGLEKDQICIIRYLWKCYYRIEICFIFGRTIIYELLVDTVLLKLTCGHFPDFHHRFVLRLDVITA